MHVKIMFVQLRMIVCVRSLDGNNSNLRDDIEV